MMPRLTLLCLLTIARVGFSDPASAGAYEPRQAVAPPGSGYVLPDGSVQIVACADLAGAVGALDRLFEATHPNTRISLRVGNNASALSALTFGSSAVAAMGAEPTASGLYGHVKLVGLEPLGIRIAHGSLKPEAAVSPLCIIVNRANPLQSLSMAQLTSLFALGAPKGDYSRWSQVGVSGSLGHREVHPLGLPESDFLPSEDGDFGTFMVTKKLGGLHFTPTYESQERYSDVVERVRNDPQAIGLIAANRLDDTVRQVALKTGVGGRTSTGNAQDIMSGVYPLDRYLYLYVRTLQGKDIDAWVREYLRLALSSEGQACIASESAGYLPLNPREVLEELDKLR